MKKMKLIILFVLTIFVFNTYCAYASESLQSLVSIGVAPSNLSEQDMNKIITRGQYAGMVARLLSPTDMPATKTRFADVDEKSENSGEIEYLTSIGVVNGVAENTFAPDNHLDWNMAIRVLIQILGYDEIATYKGGTPEAYIKLAQDIGLLKSVRMDTASVCYGQATDMIYNMLTVKVANPNISMQNGTYAYTLPKDNENNFMCEKLGISVYTGIINEVVQSTHSAKVLIEKNQYSFNPVLKTAGEEVTFSVKGNINISKFENVPVTIWVNSKEEIIHVIVKKNVKILSGYIDSVNGDRNVNSYYGIKYIDGLSLMDDETKYKVAKGAKLKFNEEYTTKPFKLTGKFAKMILIDNQITLVESWDIKEGGLIESINKREMHFTQGENEKVILRNLDQYKTKRIFIDKADADFKDIKTKSVFSYYTNADTIVIIASERVIVGQFKGIADDTLQIGDIIYNKQDVYYSEDRISYQKNAKYEALFNRKVEAYIGSDGNAAYVTLAKNETASRTKFFGAAIGTKTHPLKETTDINMWVLTPQITKETYAVTDKTKFLDGITLNEIQQNAKNLQGKGIYQFEVNGAGMILSVARPTPFYGYGTEAKATVSTFTEYDTGYVTVNGKALNFSKEANITGLFENNGEFCVKQVQWPYLRSKYAGAETTMTFYGEEMSSEPSLIVICGDIDNIGTEKFGIVNQKREVIDENGEIRYRISVIQGVKTEQYMVTKTLADKIPGYAFISYYGDTQFSADEIYLKSVIDLSKPTSEWATQSKVDANGNPKTEGEGLYKGVVVKYDDTRLYLDDGTAYFKYLMRENFYIRVNEKSPNNRFQIIESDKIAKGDTVFYYLVSGARLYGIFLAD